LEQVVILAVNERDFDRQACKALGDLQAAKAGADNDDLAHEEKPLRIGP